MLPIGVVLPTRDSQEYLEDHLRGLEGWLDQVEEIVAVDSHSSDGTREMIEARLRHPAVRFHQHPPGLYASWNFGIRQLRAKYTYISTVGDRITRKGLEHLVGVAEALEADVVVSPPTIVDMQGRAVSGLRWPVHELIQRLRIVQPGLLHPAHAFFYAVVFGVGDFLRSILGSSASNLYNTEVLQRRPFPTDRGRVGDTFWGVEHSLEVSLAITPRACASFRIHPTGNDGDEATTHALLHDTLIDRSRQLLRAAYATALSPVERSAFEQLESYIETREKYGACGVDLKRYRQLHPAWYVRPEGWKIRSTRNAQRGRLARIKQDVDGTASRLFQRSADSRSEHTRH